MRENFNSLLRHFLDRISHFGNYLHFPDTMIFHNDISLGSMCYSNAFMSNDVLVKFVQTAVDSYCVIRGKLNCETKQGCAQELINAMAQTLIIVRALILIMIKRSDKHVGNQYNSENFNDFKSDSNYRITRILLAELLNRCPTVSAPFHGFASPVAHILFNIHYKPLLYTHLTEKCPRYHQHFMMMLIQSQCDLNDIDFQGNTILHHVIRDFLQEIDYHHDYHGDNQEILIDQFLKIVKMLLDSGSYPHAKNKDGKCPFDEITDAKLCKFNPKDIIMHCEELTRKYDCTLTLRYLAATKIVYYKIPYRNLLPEALIKFVDLH